MISPVVISTSEGAVSSLERVAPLSNSVDRWFGHRWCGYAAAVLKYVDCCTMAPVAGELSVSQYWADCPDCGSLAMIKTRLGQANDDIDSEKIRVLERLRELKERADE